VPTQGRTDYSAGVSQNPTLPTTLTAPDGTALAVWHWPAMASRAGDAAPKGTVKGTVQLVHGLGEHLGRHATLAQALAEVGWHVVGHDLRGHGRSAGARGGLRQGDDLLTDLALVMDTVHAALPGPHVLLGHSVGALVTATFVASRQRVVDALVLSSPALDAGLGRWQRLRLAVWRALAQDLPVRHRLQVQHLSRDPAVAAAYRADPLVHDRITARLAGFVQDAQAYVFERAASWSVPTLLMWAGADRIVRPSGSARFAERVPANVISARRFKGWAHEIFHEPNAREAVDHLLQWLDDRLDSTTPVAHVPTPRPTAKPEEHLTP